MADHDPDFHETLEVDEVDQSWLLSQTSRYLLAGGVAGAGESFFFFFPTIDPWSLVSRSATAPFDRLKIFLITRQVSLQVSPGTPAPVRGMRVLTNAISNLYIEGGIRAFWVGQSLLDDYIDTQFE